VRLIIHGIKAQDIDNVLVQDIDEHIYTSGMHKNPLQSK